jgi:hypothetical protein
MMNRTEIYKMELDPRMHINHAQVTNIARVIEDFPVSSAFNFVSDFLPPINHPITLDYFFTVILQQFGFWTVANDHYNEPLIATMDGKRMKGSTYLFHAYTRLLDDDPNFFTPKGQANLTMEEFEEIFRDDNGVVQMPALDLHLQLANQYGRDMLELRLTPDRILDHAQGSGVALLTITAILCQIGGYREDPLQKKTNLLALCLSQRPEALLPLDKNEAIGPIVDYHCMRSILRIGMIDVLDEQLSKKLTQRSIATFQEEWAVRFASYKIIQQLVELSGRPLSVVDQFLFGYMRTHCPEMSEPICSECILDGLCAKRKKMFQPVFRTTFY